MTEAHPQHDSYDDGTYLALLRFASAEDARRNSDRPEQAACVIGRA